MAHHHRRIRCWLAVFSGIFSFSAVSAADPLPQQVEHPFRNLAAWLREASPDLRSADPKTISRGITVLSNSQSYVKSFDGMAYELKGKLKEGTSTSDIETLRDQAQLYESATSAKKAGKLVKLLIEVEKALNSAEAAEIAAQFDPAVTARYMNDAGLRFLPTPPPPPPPPRENVTDDKTNTTSTEEIREGTDIGVKKSTGTGVPNGGKGANGTKLPRRGASKNESEKGKRRPRSSKASPRKGSRSDRRSQGERVRDDGAGGQTLSGLGGEEDEDEVGAPLGEFIVGVAGCEVQCLLMVDEREGRLVVAVGDALTGEALMGSLIEEPEMVQLASHGLMRETAYVNRAAFQCACDILEWAGPFIEASLATAPFEGYPVHCAGHSFGGAVAACLAGLLDGAIDVEAEGRTNGENPASRPAEDKNRGANARRRAGEQHQGRRKAGGVAWSESVSDSDSDGSGESDGEDILRVDGAAPWVGVCRDKVTCVTLGCPPCLSRSLRLPFVTSFVLGDDMVPRTSHESLRRLKRRLLQVMPKGKGLLSQGMAFSTSLFTDVAGVAMQSVRQATTLGEDDARLTVPGRVWFAKPRRLKNGATLARVMQGNVREDMLWQLHDIMLTKSMLSHHRLDKYIKILDRV